MRRGFFNSTIARLTLALVLAQVLALVLGLTIIHRFTQSTILADARTAAEVARDDFIDDYRQNGLPSLQEAIRERLQAKDDRNFVVLLKGPDGRRMAGNLREWPATIGNRTHWQQLTLFRVGGTVPERMGLISTPLPGGYVLLTGEILEAQAQLARASETAFFYALVVGIFIAAIMAAVVAWILAQRINAFSRAASEFVAGRFHARVERDRTGDAFDRLAVSINAMFARIESLVRELRMVTDSMAHDLRSPVSRMKARLEQALAKTRDPDAVAALAGSIEEADSLHRLLDTALEISRAEAGLGRDQFSRVPLKPLIDDLAEVYGPLAEDQGFIIHTEAPQSLEVFAHREMLLRALSNLVDNALKYAIGGSSIRIVASANESGQLELRVSDDGPGLAENQMTRARHRFVRLDPARGGSGAGLGLSLVETIAHLHGGTMRLEPNHPHGLTVVLTLPVIHTASTDEARLALRKPVEPPHEGPAAQAQDKR